MSHADIVLQTEHLSDEASAWLGQHCRLVMCQPDAPGFPSVLSEAAGLVVRTYTIVDESRLAGAPRLKVIGRAGTGLDNIDVAACRARGVEVVYTPEANTQAVVEYVICLLGDALRPRIELQETLKPSQWHDLRETMAARHQMDQLTLGILGLGRVGKRLAKAAAAIGFNVLYNDLVDIPSDQRHGAVPLPVRALFESSDVLSIHIDGRPTNHRFINEELLDLLKPEVVLLNTSRGLVVDNLALRRFLMANLKALAMLDVHDPEPFDAGYPLLGLPNARLYPHLASRTKAAMDSMSWVVKDVVAVLGGRPPQFPAPHETPQNPNTPI